MRLRATSEYPRSVRTDAAPYPCGITNRDIHLWRVSVPLLRQTLLQLEQLLTVDERARADRFFFPKDRNSFVTARGVLRIILARYLDEDPRRLRFAYGLQGKPRLSTGASRLHFNIAHSGARVLIAVAKEFDVGVDIEEIREELASGSTLNVFSQVERSAIAKVGYERRLQAFFKCWTSKEAYIKGIGAGFTIALTDFDVCVDPDKPARLLRPFSQAQGRWYLHRIDEGCDYAATLATMRRDGRLSVFDVGMAWLHRATEREPLI